MTDAVEVAIIMSVPGTLAAVIGLYNGFIARRTERHTIETKDVMVTLEKNTNAIKDELVKSTQKEAFAAGQLDQKQRHEKSSKESK